ncbi:MAG: sulfotransferase [Planctomycetes bacterium]|nr:sulfotransferase [Planctomycetota bacterium]
MINPFISNMIFICGFTRGGTSWLRRTLCNHPDLTIVPGEVVFSRVEPLTRRFRSSNPPGAFMRAVAEIAH